MSLFLTHISLYGMPDQSVVCRPPGRRLYGRRKLEAVKRIGGDPPAQNRAGYNEAPTASAGPAPASAGAVFTPFSAKAAFFPRKSAPGPGNPKFLHFGYNFSLAVSPGFGYNMKAAIFHRRLKI